MKRYTSFIFVVWSIVTAIILFEVFSGVLSIFFPVFSAPLFKKINIASPEPLYLLVPNKDLMYIPKPNVGWYNADGYGGALYPLEKPGNKERIIMMGDSVVASIYLFEDNDFTERLNIQFNDRYEFMNLGVDGYNFLQEKEFLKEKGLKYKPDQVIFMITNNDLRLSSGQVKKISQKLEQMEDGYFYKYYYGMQGSLDSMLLRLKIYRWAKYYFYTMLHYQSKRTFFGNAWYRQYIDDLKLQDIIKEIIVLSRHNNFKVSFVFLPHTGGGETKERMSKVLDAENIQWLDINKHIDTVYEFQFKESLLSDGLHLNRKGEDFIFNYFCENIDRFLSSVESL